MEPSFAIALIYEFRPFYVGSFSVFKKEFKGEFSDN